MNTENTKKLLDRFPIMYQNYYLPMQQTCMCWGFDHGDGWFDLIWWLSLGIENILTEEEKRYFKVGQVKEKFGSLRFYHTGCSERAARLINYAEILSSYICELCGAPGKLGKANNWLSTRCNKCKQDGWKAFSGGDSL